MIDTSKVDLTSKSLDKLVEIIAAPKPEQSIWKTLIPLIIGAVLTLLIQFLLERNKTKRETRSKKIQLLAKARAKTYLISQILKDLSMYKAHKQYYRRGAELSVTSDKTDSDDSWKKHYEKGQEARETEGELDIAISEFIEIIYEYLATVKATKKYETEFNLVYEFKHPISSKFNECNNSSDLVTALGKEEIRLYGEYQKLIGNLNSISDAIQT